MIYKSQIDTILTKSGLNKLFENFEIDFQQTYFVGGVVRSIFFKDQDCYDLDIVVPKLKENMVNFLSQNYEVQYYPSYKSLCFKNQNYEIQINSFRKDISSTGRHAKTIETSSLKEDSKRRDFTINSVYLNLNGEVFDFYSGIEHLKKNLVKFIFDPIDQIQKDYLRAIRYIRFLSLFKNPLTESLDIEAILLLSKNIFEFVKKNKIKEEFSKLSKMPYPKNSLKFIQDHKELNRLLEFLK